MRSQPDKSTSVVPYFLLVFGISLPLSLAGTLIRIELMPGAPLSALLVDFCPMIAALILSYREAGGAGAARLLRRAFDYKRIGARIWYAPVLLFMPAVMTLEFLLLRATGSPIPAPEFPFWLPLLMFAALFLGGLGEELGWMGYAIDRLQRRWSALFSAIFLGLAWAAWHIVPVLQVGRSPEWIAWQCLFWVSSRVILVWLFNNMGKSVFAMALFHSMLNVTWQLFPVDGSFYDPRLTALIVTFAALIVTLVWGAPTLSRRSPTAADVPPVPLSS